MKKIVSLLLVFSFLVVPTNFVFAQAATERPLEHFLATDIEDHWGYDTLSDFLFNGIVTGYIENEEVLVKPDKNITRAEVIALLVRSLELEKDGTAITFTDLRAGHWATGDIEIASSNGIVLGDDKGHINADAPIKREELAAMIVRTFEDTVDFSEGTPAEFTDVRSSYWATNYINNASKVGIIEGYNNKFSPSNNAKRAEAIVMIGRALNLEVGNVVDDEVLVNHTLTSENAGYDLLAVGNIEALKAHNKTYYTGFHRALANSTVELLETEGLDLTITLTEALEAEVVSKNDRFAVVEMTAGKAEFTVTFGSTTITDVQSVEGTFLLRKINGEWMIYFTDVELAL